LRDDDDIARVHILDDRQTDVDVRGIDTHTHTKICMYLHIYFAQLVCPYVYYLFYFTNSTTDNINNNKHSHISTNKQSQ